MEIQRTQEVFFNLKINLEELKFLIQGMQSLLNFNPKKGYPVGYEKMLSLKEALEREEY